MLVKRRSINQFYYRSIHIVKRYASKKPMISNNIYRHEIEKEPFFSLEADLPNARSIS